MPLAAGQQLLHYRLAEPIGEGGMGVVWKAMDTSLGREVAIKVLPDAVAGDAERLARFEREARLLAALNHPHVASVYGLHEDGGVRFLVMELVPGEDLSARLAHGPLPIPEALRIGREIAEGLEAAHERGIVHRDLKPGNVRLTADGAAKVLDFGLAKGLETPLPESDIAQSPTLTAAGTVAGIVLGTAAYMSPEQAAGQPIDRRCDIWSFGVVLHELLTGRRMFAAETTSHTLADVLRAPIDLADLPPATPARGAPADRALPGARPQAAAARHRRGAHRPRGRARSGARGVGTDGDRCRPGLGARSFFRALRTLGIFREPAGAAALDRRRRRAGARRRRPALAPRRRGAGPGAARCASRSRRPTRGGSARGTASTSPSRPTARRW